tara:strand:+ start:7337 stop:9592 length:2256 start_codon:yes stop_codon:yes gene_type:complete
VTSPLPRLSSRQFPLTIAFLCSLSLAAQAALPGTKALDWEGDLAERMLDGAHRFLDQKLKDALDAKSKVPADPKELARILGVMDDRLPFESPQLVNTTTHTAKVGSGAGYEILAIRWPTLEGVFGEGLLLRPVGKKPVANVIAIPDADQSPESLAGLTDELKPESQFARRLAENGCRVIVPALIHRKVRSHSERRKRVQLSDREFLHRSAFLMGRTLQGLEIQKALSLVDWLTEKSSKTIGLVGWGEGGILGLRAAALDPRVDAVFVSGSFGPREDTWLEPLERNVFGLLPNFGDAELAAMTAPRGLVIEAAKGPEVVIASMGAAPGRLTTPSLENVRREFTRASHYVRQVDPQSPLKFFLSGKGGQGIPGGSQALDTFFRFLVPGKSMVKQGKPPQVLAVLPNKPERQARAFREIDQYVQRLLDKSDLARAAHFKPNLSSLEAFAKSTVTHRKRFDEEVIGRFTDDFLPLSPRSRKTHDQAKWTGHEVVLDVYPDLIAFGILLVPKKLKPGERRPVVVCQHGLEGRPRDVIEGDHRAYHDFAAKLCEKGYVVFAPQNPYLMGDKFRSLQRKANPLGKTLFSLIVAQHRQIVRWLGELPFTDPKRIAFYGLSYGGKTAMRVPALVEGYALSICSADFNEWIHKTGSTRDDRYTYPFTGEYEIFEFNLGHTFNYSDMAALIAPRPFMVERGHFDGVAPDEWVAAEYAKVRRLYARLGIPEKTEIEWFLGPHTINGQGTFRFLDKWLDWPAGK